MLGRRARVLLCCGNTIPANRSSDFDNGGVTPKLLNPCNRLRNQSNPFRGLSAGQLKSALLKGLSVRRRESWNCIPMSIT